MFLEGEKEEDTKARLEGENLQETNREIKEIGNAEAYREKKIEMKQRKQKLTIVNISQQCPII